MATYFHGSTSEIQSSAEGLQTLYLMNPNYVPYSDAAQHPTPNMLLVNPNTSTTSSPPANALNLSNFSHAPPPPSPNNNHHHQQQHLLGVTIPSSNILGSTTTDTPNQRSFLGQHEISAFHGFPAAATSAANNPRLHYNLWGSIFNQTPSLVTAATIAIPTFRSFSGEMDASGSRGGDDVRVVGNGISSMQSVVLGSKYLKAAQEVLDEVVNVEKMKANIESTSGGENSGGGKQQAGGVELSTAQRQELQMKKTKLVTMLDEVELRYRQYHQQMQMVISSFEQAAGYGAAKSYTALALKTISKQFRCLKDAIASQIKTTCKSLGEDDCLGAKVEGSRLRYVDHHLRQQRALQQLGMIQHNAWRPQRGLPERAVSVLRAWLFEHFLHPYPKDSDKVMLAKQTGLTRSQVSNWFINARVRLWKPMVEEMYMEEIKDQEQNSGSQDNTNKSKDQSSKELWSGSANATHESSGAIKLHSKAESFNNQNTSPTEISNSNSLSTSPIGGGGGSFQSFHLTGSSPNKPRSNSEMQNSQGSTLSGETPNRDAVLNTKFDIERHRKDGYSLMTSGNESYGAFSMEDIGRFNVTDQQQQLAPRFHGNGVSLTLGLPHNENLSLSAATQHGFLSQNMHLGMGSNENEFCAINSNQPSSHSATSYESIDIQNRKRFAAAQLLRDFVA
ncbi:POX domain [Sesbania bispinosa]|nr:POX domain [Sesbania bispinosa]